MKILHVSPHVGGGVGTVVSNMLKFFSHHSLYQHELACLDKLRPESIYFLTSLNIGYIDDIAADLVQLKCILDKSDIVVLHWWNHPLAGYFLYKLKMMGPLRLVIWCHISGLNEPNVIPNDVIEISDRFIFTSPLSFGAKSLKCISYLQKCKLSWIWSTRGVEYMNVCDNKTQEETVRLLYVGNLDYAKVSSTFFEIAEALCNTNVLLDIVGPKNEIFLADLSKSSVSKYICYHGFIDEAEKCRLLQAADIFLYPLAPHHYGTCDQSIQEAMAYGVVPIVYANSMEKYMIDDHSTGFIANTAFDFISKAKELIRDRALRCKISQNCQIFSQSAYTLSGLLESWDLVLTKALDLPKTIKTFLNTSEDDLGYQLFLSTVPSISDELQLLSVNSIPASDLDVEYIFDSYFKTGQQTSPGKSSIKQFLEYFPRDAKLSQLALLIDPSIQKS